MFKSSQLSKTISHLYIQTQETLLHICCHKYRHSLPCKTCYLRQFHSCWYRNRKCFFTAVVTSTDNLLSERISQLFIQTHKMLLHICCHKYRQPLPQTTCYLRQFHSCWYRHRKSYLISVVINTDNSCLTNTDNLLSEIISQLLIQTQKMLYPSFCHKHWQLVIRVNFTAVDTDIENVTSQLSSQTHNLLYETISQLLIQTQKMLLRSYRLKYITCYLRQFHSCWYRHRKCYCTNVVISTDSRCHRQLVVCCNTCIQNYNLERFNFLFNTLRH